MPRFLVLVFLFAGPALCQPLQFVDRYTSTLSSGCTSPCTSLAVTSATGLPSGTSYYFAIVRADGANTEEVFLVTSRTGTTLTVTGAQAGTSASSHGSGATIIASIMTATAFTQLESDTQSSTATLTNKTLDAEGTGNVITIPFKIYIAAAGANQSSSGPAFDVPTANGPTANYYGTAPQAFGGLDFADGSVALTATAHIALPSDWSGAIDLKYFWFSGSTSTNSVVWTAATSCVADTEDLLAPTFNTTQTVSDANNSTANTRNSATISNITTTGCSAGETLFLRIGRDPTNGSDTLAATATLLGLEITLRRAM